MHETFPCSITEWNKSTTLSVESRSQQRHHIQYLASCESIFRLLLDGTGIGTHCNPDMEFTMDSFSRPPIQELVRRVDIEEKAAGGKRGSDVQRSSSKRYPSDV